LKNGGWETILSFWVLVTFQGGTVSFGRVEPRGFPQKDARRGVLLEGAWRHALDLYFSMKPDTISSNVTISACGRAGQWQHALSHGCIAPQPRLRIEHFGGDFTWVYFVDGKSMMPNIQDTYSTNMGTSTPSRTPLYKR